METLLGDDIESRRDAARGLYHKYTVVRTDGGSEPGQKHENCRYFVLDLDHDPFAHVALEAYERACLNYYPKLAIDLVKLRSDIEESATPEFQQQIHDASKRLIIRQA